MVPALLAESGAVAQHHPLGASTGYMADTRGDWPAMVAAALDTSPFAAELAALSEDELPGLEAYLATQPELPFGYLSVHAPCFSVLPEAGFCLDVAHVLSVDQTMVAGELLLDAFAGRLRHLHVSSLDGACRHVPLTVEHETRYAELLRRCPDVPWILEAPLP